MKREDTLPIWDDLRIAPRVRSAHASAPFSREILLRSILPSGIEFDRAVEIIHQTEMLLSGAKKKSVPSNRIKSIVYDLFSKTVSPASAERYALWRKFKKDVRPFILLAGGAPGVGKTSVAASAAYRLGIDYVINTDSLIPNWAAFLSRSKSLSKNTLIAAFEKTAKESNSIVYSAINDAIRHNRNTIVHGAVIVPGLLNIRQFQDDAVIITVTLALRDKDELFKRFNMKLRAWNLKDYERALWEIHNSLTDRSIKFHIPIVYNNSLDDTISRIVLHSTNFLKKRLSKGGMLEDAIENLRLILAEVHTRPRKGNLKNRIKRRSH